jgi:hypothetical protein
MMPYEWLEPELFLEHAGVAIYHCYDDDNVVSTYWYTTDASDCNVDAPAGESSQFDVRDLPDLGLATADRASHATIIKDALSAGILTGSADE